MATLVNVEKLAKAFNRDTRRIQQLVKEGMPRQARGQYDLGACMLWYIRYLQDLVEKKSANVGGGEFLGLNDQRVRGLRADAELKEMELALKRGQTAKLADVRAALSDLVLMTKARLLAVPPRLAVEVMGEGSRVMIQAKIEQAIKDALNQLADDGSNYPSRK
jgi:phage terminase Nu1 subunit (DNA packaging protein)